MTPRTVTAAITPRMGEVLDLVAQGRSNAEIATAMGISYTTVKNYLVGAFDVLGVANRTEAAIAWRREKTIPVGRLESALSDIDLARNAVRKAIRSLETP